jgi:hypothetical protein
MYEYAEDNVSTANTMSSLATTATAYIERCLCFVVVMTCSCCMAAFIVFDVPYTSRFVFGK